MAEYPEGGSVKVDRYAVVDLASPEEMRLDAPLNCRHGVRWLGNDGPPCADCGEEALADDAFAARTRTDVED